MKKFEFRVQPRECPFCGGFMVQEKVTPHMKRVLRKKSGRKFGVMAWRGAFCPHRIAMVGAGWIPWR